MRFINFFKKNKLIRSVGNIQEIIDRNNVKLIGLGGLPIVRSEFRFFSSNFEIICASETGEMKSVQKKIKVTCFPRKTDKGGILKKPGVLIKDAEINKYIKDVAKEKKVVICVQQPSEGIEKECQKNGWVMMANSVSLFKKFEDRSRFYEILEGVGYERNFLKFKFSELKEGFLERIFDQLGDKVVIQTMGEGGGKGTFFFDRLEKNNILKEIKERSQIRKMDLNEMELVANPFVSGPSISASGCVTRKNGILSTYARYQLVDIAEAVSGKQDAKGVFCGHDWSLSDEIPEYVHEEVEQIIEKVGNFLKSKGYLGMFGIDFIWDQKKKTVFPVELNPRLVGALPTSVYVQLEKGEVPLEAFHVLEFLGVDYEISDKEVYKKDSKRNGAHLILFNPFNYDVECAQELNGGVYKLKGDRIVFERLGFELEDIENDDEFILTDGVPITGVLYGENRKMLKIITKRALAENEGRNLNDWGKKIVKSVYQELNLKPYDK